MNKHLIITFFVIFLWGLTACNAQLSEHAINTAIAQTFTEEYHKIINSTPSPSITHTIPPSSTPSNTPSPTNTKTPTPTLTLTPSPLPPATQTAEAIALIKTQNAQFATATREAYVSKVTATAVARSAKKTQIAEYKEIYWRELVNYPEQHVGEKVKVKIAVFNIVSNTELQGWLSQAYEAIYVQMKEPFSGLYPGNWINIYGVIEGKHCGTNAFGAEICQPFIKDAFYEKY